MATTATSFVGVGSIALDNFGSMYGELSDFDCPEQQPQQQQQQQQRRLSMNSNASERDSSNRPGLPHPRRTSIDRRSTLRAPSEMSLTLDDLQLTSMENLGETTTSSTNFPTSPTSSSSSGNGIGAGFSLSSWNDEQESAISLSNSRGSLSDRYDTRIDGRGNDMALARFPSLGSVIEDLSDRDEDDELWKRGDHGETYTERLPDIAESSQEIYSHHSQSTTRSFDKSHQSSKSLSLTLGLSSSLSASTAINSSISTGGSGTLGRHVRFEAPARLEEIQEFDKPDHEDYHLLYYMSHEIQRMMDEYKEEDDRARTILR